MRLLRRVVVLALAAGAAYLVVTAIRVVQVAGIDDRGPSDAIVVLGASQRNGKPAPVLQARLEQAMALYAERAAPRVVTVGGGRPGDRSTEARAGKEWLVEHGVPAEDVIAVPVGSDTFESLEAVSAQLRDKGWRSVVLVTDPWHELRSRTMARDLGLDAVTSPTRSGPSTGTPRSARYIARETLAYAAYSLLGERASRVLGKGG
ncbi:YdcF family protein [Motilibacter aurantiacus]|uniref:YdcF family protein n=1 Tax=Motilibacter aurantiacus TaxID=2714955 RepID=UPI0014072EE3|nr:YdcF family protein [Motilibacter aurantiacus]NHC45034.1 YdcF family protein [Motilibacter aurantiacus]